MKCQILFSGKNKKNISKCNLLIILPRVKSINSLYSGKCRPNLKKKCLEIVSFVDNLDKIPSITV